MSPSPTTKKTSAKKETHRTIRVGPRRTSLRCSDELIDALAEIAVREGQTPSELFAAIARDKPAGVSLTVEIRLYAMRYFREACTEEGHRNAGHGRPHN